MTDKTTEEGIRKATADFLMNNDLPGWTFRCAKVMKAVTIVNLDRQAGAKTWCDLCGRHHEKDNTLYLKFTAKRVEAACLKNRSGK